VTVVRTNRHVLQCYSGRIGGTDVRSPVAPVLTASVVEQPAAWGARQASAAGGAAAAEAAVAAAFATAARQPTPLSKTTSQQQQHPKPATTSSSDSNNNNKTYSNSEPVTSRGRKLQRYW